MFWSARAWTGCEARGVGQAHPAIRPEQAHSVAMTIEQSQSQTKSALDRLPVAERLGFCGVKVRVAGSMRRERGSRIAINDAASIGADINATELLGITDDTAKSQAPLVRGVVDAAPVVSTVNRPPPGLERVADAQPQRASRAGGCAHGILRLTPRHAGTR